MLYYTTPHYTTLYYVLCFLLYVSVRSICPRSSEIRVYYDIFNLGKKTNKKIMIIMITIIMIIMEK